MKFPSTTKENKFFIQNVAEFELGYAFSLPELDILLKDMGDEFIVNPLNTYPTDHFDRVDTFDRYVIADVICKQITGLEFDPSLRDYVTKKISINQDWINDLYKLDDLREYQEKRHEITRTLLIDDKKFPDTLKISSSQLYTEVFAEFLLENTDELNKRLEAARMKFMASELADDIFAFIEQYAEIKADFDPDYDEDSEKFASPDASILYAAAEMLKKDHCIPDNFSLASSWGSGGYSPYTSKEGEKTHDLIINKLSQFINKA
jgi:hypothetical protein